MDSISQIKSPKGENVNTTVLHELQASMHKMMSGFEDVRYDINQNMDKKLSEGLEAFRVEMKTVLENVVGKTENDIKDVRQALHEALNEVKMDLGASVLTLDVKMDKVIEDNLQTQKTNIANIKELWYAVQQIEQVDVERKIDNRVRFQTAELNTAMELVHKKVNGIADKVQQMIEEGDWEIAEREPQYRPENIESRVTAIEDMTQYRYTVMKESLEKEREDIRSFKAGLETSLTAMRTDLEHKLAHFTRDPEREERRLQKAEENMDCLYHRGQELGAEINRINADIVLLNGREVDMSETLQQVNEMVGTLGQELNTSVAELRTRVEEVATMSQTSLPHEWFQDDDETSKSKSKRTKDKSSKRRKTGQNGKVKCQRRSKEPDGSDGSSSSSSDDTDKSSRKRTSSLRRKKDTSSDSSEGDSSSEESKPLLRSRRFKAGNRRASVIGDDDDHSSLTGGVGRRSQNTVVVVQNNTPTKELYLEEVKIGNVLSFCKRFNNESSKVIGGLRAANYINERVLSQMRQVAIKHNMPGKHGILSNGKQQITDRQIFAILSLMCAPATLEHMQLELSMSAWPKCKHDYRNPDNILNNIGDYRIDMLIYTDRFEDKLKLLRFHKESAKFIPKALFRKGGGNPGLADYYLGGLPDKKFGLRVWQSVDEDKRTRCERWDKFIKYYMRAIEMMEKREMEKEINQHICKGVNIMVKNKESKKKDYHAPRRVQNVHNVEEEGVIDLSNDLEDEDIEEDDECKAEEEPDLSPIMPNEDDCEDDDNESDITGEDLAQLVSALQPSEPKKTGVCFELAFKGKCDRVNCQYSHKDEDIARIRKLKAVKLQTPPKFQGTKKPPINKVNQNLRKT